MNVVVTLPKKLINAIIDGRKSFEMRSWCPRKLRVKEDGFFCVEKGTKNVHCWCRVDRFLVPIDYEGFWKAHGERLCVSKEWYDKYVQGRKYVRIWCIGKVIKFEKTLSLDKDLFVDRAPQSYVYTPLSYGECF